MKGSGGLRQLLVWMSFEKDIKTKDFGETGELESLIGNTPCSYDQIARFTVLGPCMQAGMYVQM